MSVDIGGEVMFVGRIIDANRNLEDVEPVRQIGPRTVLLLEQVRCRLDAGADVSA